MRCCWPASSSPTLSSTPALPCSSPAGWTVQTWKSPCLTGIRPAWSLTPRGAPTGGGLPRAQPGEASPPAAAQAGEARGMGTFLDLYSQFAGRGADRGQTQNEPLRSLLTVPFQAEGRVTGMLAVAAAEPDRFAETDLARVQQVADAVALPLERARLSEHDRVRRARLSFLAQASDLLAGM